MKNNERIESVVLNIVEQKVKTHIHDLDLDLNNLSVETRLDHVTRGMVVELCRRRARQELGEISFSVPKDWFQHFKKRFFPKWVLKKFPVKYQTIAVDAVAFYDRLAVPKETTEIKLSVLKGSEFIT